MTNIVEKILSPVLEDKKIKIPEWSKRVKIDVGTSKNAPFSEFWLNNDSELCVFAFEPNIYNIEHFKYGNITNQIQISKDKIGKNFFYLNCALSDFISEKEIFYCTLIDGGTSSLFLPTVLEVSNIIETPVITLESFFDFFPWEKINYIDQIKIDAQSSDFNIIKGIGKYLTNNIVYIDVETTTEGHYHHEENPNELKIFLEDNGFECIKWGLDATFFNLKFKELKNIINYSTLH